MTRPSKDYKSELLKRLKDPKLVLYDLTVKAGVKFEAYYSATGIDPPEVMKFIREHYRTVKWLRPKFSFIRQIAIHGQPPTRFRRWC